MGESLHTRTAGFILPLCVARSSQDLKKYEPVSSFCRLVATLLMFCPTWSLFPYTLLKNQYTLTSVVCLIDFSLINVK